MHRAQVLYSVDTLRSAVDMGDGGSPPAREGHFSVGIGQTCVSTPERYDREQPLFLFQSEQGRDEVVQFKVLSLHVRYCRPFSVRCSAIAPHGAASFS